MAKKKKNWSVKADIGKNRLYFNISGGMTTQDANSLYTETRFCVADLKPGFDVITDLTKCNIGTLSILPTIRKIIHYLISNKVGEVVRVMDKKSVLYKQVINFVTRTQGYKPINVSSLEEAEKKIEDSIKRKGLRVHLHNPPVQITLTGEETRKGSLANISISGCAVICSGPFPQKNEEVVLKIELSQGAPTVTVFDLKTRVVRVDSNGFATEFLNVEKEIEKKLWECLAHESQCALKEDVVATDG